MSTEMRSAGDAFPARSAVIEVHVHELNQLFNSMDPSPFFDKDLDVDAEEFIVSWAKELPDDVPLALMVHLDKPTVGAKDWEQLRNAVHTFFAHRAELTQRRFRDLLRRGRTSLLIGLICLTGSILLGNWVGAMLANVALAQVVQESFLIGGWVSMWRPMEIFLYDWWPIRNERRVFDRLSECAVRIACKSESPPAPPVAG